LRESRDKAYREVGALAAREMRSPLVSIRTHAASLGKLLPPLVRRYAEGSPEPTQDPALPEAQLRALERVPAGIDDAVQQINGFIQVLLAQAGQESTDQEDHRSLPISRCIDDAIARLPLRPELDHARIVFHREQDFRFTGSLVLMTHVLARVLEASFDAIYTDPGAKLVIVLGVSGGWNYIRIEDSSASPQSTGPTGVSRLFSRTDAEFSDRHDLTIASLVMQRIGGFVTRSLEFGRTTRVTLWFPQPGAADLR
jgi:signal transduction histidine kinase